MIVIEENLEKAEIAPVPGWSAKERLRRCGGEAIGTFTIVFAASGSAASNQLSGGQLGLLGQALASGLAVMAMVYALGHICNAHFNPAVTLAFSVTRHFPLREVPGYIMAQLSGAVLAGLAVRSFFGSISPNRPAGSPWQALALE